MFFITVRTQELDIPHEVYAATMQEAMRSFVHSACKEYPDYLHASSTFADALAWYAQHEMTVTISYDEQ